MKRLAVVIGAVVLAGGAGPYTKFYSLGGGESCAASQQSADTIRDENIWIEGYWSGRNAETGSLVGSTTDALGVIGEVKLLCAANPSMIVLEAVDRVYTRMKAAHK